jgi:predicted neutral ceramidase superfamily lipid hydrolase
VWRNLLLFYLLKSGARSLSFCYSFNCRFHWESVLTSSFVDTVVIIILTSFRHWHFKGIEREVFMLNISLLLLSARSLKQKNNALCCRKPHFTFVGVQSHFLRPGGLSSSLTVKFQIPLYFSGLFSFRSALFVVTVPSKSHWGLLPLIQDFHSFQNSFFDME